MDAVKIIQGTAVPLDRSDVDTDQIIPAEWLKRVERTGFGVGLFSAWREKERDFVLNRAEHAGATVLVAGPNFGVGSSREQAAAALLALGVGCIVAVSFARIFYRNAINLGLPVLACRTAREIPSGARLRVDPAAGEVTEVASGRAHRCEPIPGHLLDMIADGGLLPHLERRLSLRKEMSS